MFKENLALRFDKSWKLVGLHTFSGRIAVEKECQTMDDKMNVDAL